MCLHFKSFAKTTNPMFFLNYYAIYHWNWFNCLLNRAFNVCGNWSLFHQDISIFINIFHQDNSFCVCVNEFLKNQYNSNVIKLNITIHMCHVGLIKKTNSYYQY